MSESAPCPVCGDEVHHSYAGWARHTDGLRHQLALLGLSTTEAERIATASYDAGVSVEAAMAAVRFALSRPPEELARIAQQLRDFAASS